MDLVFTFLLLLPDFFFVFYHILTLSLLHSFNNFLILWSLHMDIFFWLLKLLFETLHHHTLIQRFFFHGLWNSFHSLFHNCSKSGLFFLDLLFWHFYILFQCTHHLLYHLRKKEKLFYLPFHLFLMTASPFFRREIWKGLYFGEFKPPNFFFRLFN